MAIFSSLMPANRRDHGGNSGHDDWSGNGHNNSGHHNDHGDHHGDRHGNSGGHGGHHGY